MEAVRGGGPHQDRGAVGAPPPEFPFGKGGLMHVRVLTLPFDDRLGGFDESALQTLTKDKHVLSIHERSD